MKLIAILAGVTLAAAGTAQQFGEAMPAGLEARSLGAAIAAFDADAGKQVISGRVGKVCQAKGCWMQLIDGELSARVKTDHKFFLPKDFSGNALVYGELVKVELDAKQAEHYAKESGDGSQPGIEYQVKAVGITRQD